MFQHENVADISLLIFKKVCYSIKSSKLNLCHLTLSTNTSTALCFYPLGDNRQKLKVSQSWDNLQTLLKTETVCISSSSEKEEKNT